MDAGSGRKVVAAVVAESVLAFWAASDERLKSLSLLPLCSAAKRSAGDSPVVRPLLSAAESSSAAEKSAALPLRAKRASLASKALSKAEEDAHPEPGRRRVRGVLQLVRCCPGAGQPWGTGRKKDRSAASAG